jgi:hypothetical protein
MKKSTDGGGPGTRHDEGWDESVLVWNATVARIQARAAEPDTTDARGVRRVATRSALPRSPNR